MIFQVAGRFSIAPDLVEKWSVEKLHEHIAYLLLCDEEKS